MHLPGYKFFWQRLQFPCTVRLFLMITASLIPDEKKVRLRNCLFQVGIEAVKTDLERIDSGLRYTSGDGASDETFVHAQISRRRSGSNVLFQLFVSHKFDGRFRCYFHNIDAVTAPQTSHTTFMKHVTGTGSKRAKLVQSMNL